MSRNLLFRHLPASARTDAVRGDTGPHQQHRVAVAVEGGARSVWRGATAPLQTPAPTPGSGRGGAHAGERLTAAKDAGETPRNGYDPRHLAAVLAVRLAEV